MRSSHRRKRVDHTMAHAVIRKNEKRRDKQFRKKGACMRLGALAGAVAILTAGFGTIQAEAVYDAQYAVEDKEQKKIQGEIWWQDSGKSYDKPYDKTQSDSADKNQSGQSDETTSKSEDVQSGEITTEQEGWQSDETETTTEPESGQPGGTTTEQEGWQSDETETTTEPESGQSGGTMTESENEKSDETASEPEGGKSGETTTEPDSGQPDEMTEETERGKSDKPRNKENDENWKEKLRKRLRRSSSKQETTQSKLSKDMKNEAQTNAVHREPKNIWEPESGILRMLRSIGRVQYGQAVIDADDLRSICAYMMEKKHRLACIMMQMGTRFGRRAEGGYTFHRDPDVEQEDMDLSQIDWPTLCKAAAESQNVPHGLSVLNPQAAMHIEGVDERTDWYETATEDNISRGKAAWADGRLLLGNGADNDKARRQGEVDGEKGDVPDSFLPVYEASEAYVEIGHVHIGKKEKKDGTSGCYKNSHTTRQEKYTCGTELKKTDATFYPDPDKPEGGTWHGGEYTCPYHGGLYKNPGICDHIDTKTVTVWKHEIICGLENVIFARLMVGGEDTDYSDRAIYLEAVLEAGEGYEHLAWQEGDELIWTDETGNVLGIGSGLMVYEAGTYRCSLNVANVDIDGKSVDTVVKIAGLVQK